MTRQQLPLMALLAVGLSAAATGAAALDVGDPAPGFQADSTLGALDLADYRGKKNVLLAFYYKDFTGG